jgi:ubiquinol-cytochrome c reductase iron-sulfur subunit
MRPIGEFGVADAHPEAAGGEDATRRDFIYIAAGATGALGAAMVVWPFIDQMNPAADTLAMASTEVNLASVAEGQLIKPMWRGKPVFVWHRTAEQIAAAQKDDTASDLKDKQTDAQRIAQSNGDAGKPEWLILQANCTHLGCVPDFGRGDYGGWFCPCHGSQFDTSGRIRKGPAPRNLDVAPYVFVSDTVIKIG